MVIKIMKTFSSTKGTVDYNEKKVAAKEATIIGVKNLPDDSMLAIRSAFERLERRNIRSKDVSFQMSINPNPNDPKEKLTDEEAFSLAQKMMDRLGYGNQPFVVFRHNDIEREHYHVVSIRVNEMGKKIRDYKEEVAVQKAMMELQKEFHFVIGNEEKKEKIRKTPAFDKSSIPERFDPKKGNVREQFRNTFEICLGYNFTTFPQFAALMNDCGYRVELTHNEGKDQIIFQGLNAKGKPTTEIVDDKELCLGYTARIVEAMSKDKEYIKRYRENRLKLSKLALACLKLSKNENHFRAMMAKKGVGVHFTRTATDKIFGVTFVDHNTKNIFKGSELSNDLTAKVFQGMLDSRQWSTPDGDYLKLDKFETPTDVNGTGIHPIQHNESEELEESDIGRNETPGEGPDLLDELARSLAVPSKSKGKNPKKKKKKKRKPRFV